MTTAGPGDQGEERRLFATIPVDSPLHREVHAGLARLRDSTPDPTLARAVTDVLDGGSSVRDLLRVPAFAQIMAAAAERSRAEMAATSPDVLAALREQARDRA